MNYKDIIKEKLLVEYLRNSYFDDHFDLTDFKLLTGKTMFFSSSNLNIDSLLINSLQVSEDIYKYSFKHI